MNQVKETCNTRKECRLNSSQHAMANVIGAALAGVWASRRDADERTAADSGANTAVPAPKESQD